MPSALPVPKNGPAQGSEEAAALEHSHASPRGLYRSLTVFMFPFEFFSPVMGQLPSIDFLKKQHHKTP